jgi:outer membrane receptor protein involved in Fe transport
MRGTGVGAALLAWGLAVTVASGALARGQDARTLPVDTTGQSLTKALNDLARRSGRELLLAAPTLGDRAAPRLKGRYTIDQALPRLLAGSGLAYRRTPDGTYIVHVAPTLPSPSPGPETPVALPELLVTGRSQNSDIQRTENDIQAYKVWSSQDIEQAHSADINEFLRLMATGDAQIASALQDPSNTSASTRSEVDLRGMGSNQTLVLVDGRRMPGMPPAAGGAGPAVNQADINGLPLSAIDRVEILNATAGGVYGAGATAGAVNIVLKRDYHGADLGVTAGVTARGDAPARRLDGRLGFSPDDGRTEVMIAFGLLRSEGLDVGQRDYEARARARRFANAPAQALAEMPISGSVNIFSADGGALILDPAHGGTSLGAPSTFAPASYGGVARDGVAMLMANAGRLDTSLSPDAGGARRALLSRRKISSLVASARHRFRPSIEAYVDLLVLRNEGRAVVPEDRAQTLYLAADAPTNPFQQPVWITVPLPGFDPIGRNLARTTRASVGMIADLPHGWKLNADYSTGKASIDAAVTARFFKADYYRALASGQIDPLGGLQPFLDGLAGVTIHDSFAFAQSNHFRDRSLRLAGPILDLGGGPLTVTLTAEDLRERVPPSFMHLADTGSGAPTQLPIQGLIQSARHYYAELRAPLTDRYGGPAGLKGLEFQLALRREEGRQQLPIDPVSGGLPDTIKPGATQSTTVYTVGFKVTPIAGLMVRASAASGLLPPVANQISSATSTYTSDPAYATSTARVVLLPPGSAPADPRRGGEALGAVGAYDLVSGGSTGLQPERARSFSAGVVLTPRDRLRLSIDYTRIDKRQEIVSFHNGDMSYFVRNETQFPGRVTRAALSDADRAKGYAAGAVIAIDTTSFNIGRTLVEAIDVQGDYLIPTARLGDFRLHAAATWQPRLRRRANPETQVVDYVGYADGPLAWRANGGADWSRGGTALGFNVSVYDSYRVFDRLAGADEIATLTLWQGASRIPIQAYVDLFATRKITFEAAVGGLSDMQIRFGVQNVFDHAPPVIARTVGFGLTSFNYSTYGDPRRRRFELGVVGHF